MHSNFLLFRHSVSLYPKFCEAKRSRI